MRRSFLIFLVSSLYLIAAGGVSHAVSDCLYAGMNFSSGAISCQSGQQFRCSDGDWEALDLACTSPPPGPANENQGPCSCTEQETAACDQLNQGCCVSVVSGTCIKRCCPR